MGCDGCFIHCLYLPILYLSVMTRSLTAQLRAAAPPTTDVDADVDVDQRNGQFLSSQESPDQIPSAQRSSTPPSLRMPLGSCNGVSSNHGGHKRHQSLSPAPSGHMNGNGRAVTPPHTPPKLHHNGNSVTSSTSPSAASMTSTTAVQNGHSSPERTLHSSRCPPPKSPPTPHRIKLLEEKENEKKPKKRYFLLLLKVATFQVNLLLI